MIVRVPAGGQWVTGAAVGEGVRGGWGGPGVRSGGGRTQDGSAPREKGGHYEPVEADVRRPALLIQVLIAQPIYDGDQHRQQREAQHQQRSSPADHLSHGQREDRPVHRFIR